MGSIIITDNYITGNNYGNSFPVPSPQVFDAGDVFTIIKVEEVYSDEEEDDGGGTHEADEDEPAYSWQVVVNSKEGLTVDDPSQYVHISI